MKVVKKSPKGATANSKRYEGFTEAERSAMQQRVEEMKVDAANGESAVLAKIAELRDPDRTMGERIHAIIMASAPTLTPRTYYGMPAYAKDGKVLCFFKPAQKFKTRYATLGFNDVAHLDEGTMWPVEYALTRLTAADEARIGTLVKKAAG
ncbi:MAG TPA: DUF1801 domain-containing protein [Candidatus Udaeobacter sp.]|nr:DUF1801 domain-containing protein [Candidatus Udaeobacter sp.]